MPPEFLAARPISDAYGRTVSYLRISVTDRCNLRCIYCRSGMETFIPHPQILRYEEIEAILARLICLGIQKVRFTGGEPFARKGFLPFLARIRKRFPDLSLRLTTNGTLLETAIPALKELDIPVNLSLDTLQDAVFARITGADAFSIVRKNLHSLLAAEVPVKINAVALRGINESELPNFLKLAMDLPVDVRFIEFMPIGQNTTWSAKDFWPADDIILAASRLYTLIPERKAAKNSGPARLWRLQTANGQQSAGRFGVISSVTHNACAVCNRLRLTAEGALRTCLFDKRDYPIREALRAPNLGMDAVERIIRQAVWHKPVGADLLARSKGAVTPRRMSSIGG